MKVKLMILCCDYKKGEEMQEFNFKMSNSVITEASDLTDYFYRRAFERLVTGMNEFQVRGSRWIPLRLKSWKCVPTSTIH